MQQVRPIAIPGLTLREEEVGSIRYYWSVHAVEASRLQGTVEGQGWIDVVNLLMQYLIARDVFRLCHPTLSDIHQNGAEEGWIDGESAVGWGCDRPAS